MTDIMSAAEARERMAAEPVTAEEIQEAIKAATKAQGPRHITSTMFRLRPITQQLFDKLQKLGYKVNASNPKNWVVSW